MNPGASFQRLVELLAVLRGETGCPWDREQDHHSLKKFLLEEAYEVLEAIDEEDSEHLCEELGDLLMNLLFQARIAQEAGHFDIQDVCRGITEKLIRRHPHVFASTPELQAEDVARQWEQIKLQEKKRPTHTSALDGIPRNAPAFNRAQKTVQRAAQAGFAWPDAEGALAKVYEELEEVEEVVESGPKGRLEQEIGDLLFAVIGLARTVGVDAESALRGTTARFTKRFRRLEARLTPGLAETTSDEMIRIWREMATED